MVDGNRGRIELDGSGLLKGIPFPGEGFTPLSRSVENERWSK